MKPMTPEAAAFLVAVNPDAVFGEVRMALEILTELIEAHPRKGTRAWGGNGRAALMRLDALQMALVPTREVQS